MSTLRVGNFYTAYHGFSGQKAGNSSALVCLSTLTQDELNTALAQVSFNPATDFACTGTSTPQNYRATLKTQPIWNKIKNLGVIAAAGFFLPIFIILGAQRFHITSRSTRR